MHRCARFPPKSSDVEQGPRGLLERFLERVARVLESSGLPAERLCFEVTESALAAGLGLVETLRQLCDMSVGFAIDDLGTGYATLDYVRRFPMANHLKIDQSFVRGLPDDEGDRAIVSAIIHLGQALKLNVVAEGVETEAQRASLQTLQCSHYQGFLCSAAMAPSDFSHWLSRQRPSVLEAD